MSTLEQQVATYLAERVNVVTALNNCPASNMEDYYRWQGHAEARRILAESLGIDLVSQSHTVADLAAALTAAAGRDEATVRCEARQQAAQSIRDEAVDEAVDGQLPLTTILRICEETGR
ncbi:MAG TPA: hypothetical protein VGL05_19740 [Kribbella sp.]